MTEPRVSFAEGVDREAAVEQVLAILRREGVVVIDDLVSPELIARCRTEIETAYPDLAMVDRERNYGPYEGRHTMPMVVEGTVAERAIFLPREIERIAATLLGEDFLIDSLGLLVSIPGAPDQVGHPDGLLFPETRVDHIVPPFALAFSMPLVPMDDISGTTAFWRRSHRAPRGDGEHDYAPIVPPGSAILWDFRTHHRGLANRGARPRPVIYSVFARYWWVEYHPPAAKKYDKLLVERAVHAKLKPRLQRRILRAKLVDRESDTARETATAKRDISC